MDKRLNFSGFLGECLFHGFTDLKRKPLIDNVLSITMYIGIITCLPRTILRQEIN